MHYTGSLPALQSLLQQTGQLEAVEGDPGGKQVLRAFGAVDLVLEPRLVTLEWIASPCNDMFADAVLSAVLQVKWSFLPPNFRPSSLFIDSIILASPCISGRVTGESQVSSLLDCNGRDALQGVFDRATARHVW